MDAAERERLIELINNPLPGSKIAEAKDYGVDLTLLVESLELTPAERLRALDRAQEFLEELRRPKERWPVNSFEHLLTILTDSKVEFVLVGGVAMYVHGLRYLTADLDVCYERSGANIERLVRAMVPYHPRLRGAPADLPFRFDVATVTHGLNFSLSTDLGALDLFGEVIGLGAFEDVLSVSEPREVFGRTMKFLSLDALIKSKVAAGRPKDLLAVRELRALREMKRK